MRVRATPDLQLQNLRQTLALHSDIDRSMQEELRQRHAMYADVQKLSRKRRMMAETINRTWQGSVGNAVRRPRIEQ
jgi:hypothetical protein